MAPVAFIIGGVCGTISAVMSWLFFGLSLMGVFQVYFLVGLAVAMVLIAVSTVRPQETPKTSSRAKTSGLQQA